MVYSLLIREYENVDINKMHNKGRYQSHIWLVNVKILRLLVVSLPPFVQEKGKRKKDTRTIESLSSITRFKYVLKCDLICSTPLPLEFGASEAKSTIETESGTYFMNEGFYKLPQTLALFNQHFTVSILQAEES